MRLGARGGSALPGHRGVVDAMTMVEFPGHRAGLLSGRLSDEERAELDALPIRNGLRNTLARAGVSVTRAAQLTDRELLSLNNLGRTGLAQLRALIPYAPQARARGTAQPVRGNIA